MLSSFLDSYRSRKASKKKQNKEDPMKLYSLSYKTMAFTIGSNSGKTWTDTILRQKGSARRDSRSSLRKELIL